MLERVERWRRPGFGCGIGAASFHFRPSGGERGQSCLRLGYHVLWHCGISLSGCPLFRAGPIESVLSRIHHFRFVRTTVSLVFAVETIDEAAKRAGVRLEWVETGTSSDEAFQKKLVDLWPSMEAEVLGALNRQIIGAAYGIADPYHFRNFRSSETAGSELG
jgi:hypothetical protein